MSRLAHAIGLIADLAPGALIAVTGLAVMLAGATGALWH